MIEFVLVVFLSWGHGNTPVVTGFSSEKSCRDAGAQILKDFEGPLQYNRFACIRRS